MPSNPRPVPAVLLFVFTAAAFSQSTTPPAQPSQGHPPERPIAQQLFVSYWTLEPGWNTELEIRNNITQHELTVLPVLRTSAGAEIQLQQVTVPSHHVTAIDLRQAVSSIAPQLLDQPGSFGSVIYRYTGNSEGNLFGGAIVQHSGSPTGFHFDGGTYQ